jgi:conjugative transposon TraM protein
MNQKKRKLLVMPLLVIPFLTMAFWAMGGGTEDEKKDERNSGLNLQLPNAKLKDDLAENKLSFYEDAERDSLKAEEKIKNDPFFQVHEKKDSSWAAPSRSSFFDPSPQHGSGYQDPNEEKVYAKLRQLQAQISTTSPKKDVLHPELLPGARIDPDDVTRLENLLKRGDSDTGGDPQMKELNQMMDKILDIQHPERVKDRSTEKVSQKEEKWYSVETGNGSYSISLMDSTVPGEQANAFYGTDGERAGLSHNAIEAVIHETQTLVDGSIVKIRLLEDVTINQATVPKGSFVYGQAFLQGERLNVRINSIRNESSILPVKLAVYDLDGIEGIHIPGAITRDVANQSTDKSISNIEMTSIDPSFKAQAATAGVNAAKSLLTKKAKLVRVTVKAGYKVLLK